MNITQNLSQNIELLKQRLPIGTSFDILTRDLYFGDQKVYWIGMDGFAKDDILQNLTSNLQYPGFTKDNTIDDLLNYVAAKIGYIEVDTTSDLDVIVKSILSGPSVLLFDGFDTAIILDSRTYPVRGVDEPDNEKVSRGSRDGFVETIVFNTALIRRHIRDPRLTFEMKTVGQDSKTDVVVSYIDGVCDPDLLSKLKKQIDELDISSLVVGAKSLEELLIPKKWYNPLPQVRYTERPDVAASHLLEGYILVIVDNSPTVLILPTNFFLFTQNTEDYYQNPLIGNYLRLLRSCSMLVSLFLMPLFLLLGSHPELLPASVEMLQTEDLGPVKLFIYVIIIELGLDLFKYTSSSAPSGLGGSLGLIGGLVIGDVAIKLGWASSEVIFYGAVTALATLGTTSIEFGYALRMYRWVLILLTGFFGLWGFIGGIILVLISIATTKAYGGTSYLWPLIPFNGKALSSLLFRHPVPEVQNKKKNSYK